MAHGIQSIDVWTGVPVANRLVEVNTKTGFSLTAGSYLQHATNNQRVAPDITTGNASTDTTISAVTLARALEVSGGPIKTASDSQLATGDFRLTSTTNIRMQRGADTANTSSGAATVEETF